MKELLAMTGGRGGARVLVVGLAALVLGAVVSFAVATGFGLLGSVNRRVRGVAHLTADGVRRWPGNPNEFDGVDWAGYLGLIPVATQGSMLFDHVSTGVGVTDHHAQAHIPPRGSVVVAFTHCTGWPMRALQYRTPCGEEPQAMWPDDPSGWKPKPWMTASLYDASPSPMWTVRPPVPLRPLPLGFTVDTAFYAGLALAPYLIMGPARRALRRSRGRCPWCGYSRAGLAADALCPECGRKEGQTSLPNAVATAVGAPDRPTPERHYSPGMYEIVPSQGLLAVA